MSVLLLQPFSLLIANCYSSFVFYINLISCCIFFWIGYSWVSLQLSKLLPILLDCYHTIIRYEFIIIFYVELFLAFVIEKNKLSKSERHNSDTCPLWSTGEGNSSTDHQDISSRNITSRRIWCSTDFIT